MLRISFRQLSTRGLGDLAQRVCNLIESLREGILKDNPVSEHLLQKNEMYQEIVIRKTFSGKGKDVVEQDMVRDKFYRAVRRLLRTFASLPDSSRATAATTLLVAFSEAGDIKNLNYEDQNTVMRKLIKLLSTAENKAHIATLGLDSDFVALEKSQTDFEAIANLQTDENSALRQMQTASASRREMEDALRDFFALVSAMKKVTHWTELYHHVQELIKEARTPKKEKRKNEENSINEKNDELL